MKLLIIHEQSQSEAGNNQVGTDIADKVRLEEEVAERELSRSFGARIVEVEGHDRFFTCDNCSLLTKLFSFKSETILATTQSMLLTNVISKCHRLGE